MNQIQSDPNEIQNYITIDYNTTNIININQNKTNCVQNTIQKIPITLKIKQETKKENNDNPNYLNHLLSGQPRKIPLDPEAKKKYHAKLHRESTQRRREKNRNIDVKNNLNQITQIFDLLLSDDTLFENIAKNQQFRNFLKKIIELFQIINDDQINNLFSPQTNINLNTV